MSDYINETPTKITTNEGSVVLITETQYDAFIDSLIRKETFNK